MLSQLSHIKSDPLDVLLFGVGLRLSQLAKSDNAKFKSLLENRNFTIQLGSEAEGINRYFTVKDGRFSQESGEATDPTLTISFKDSLTGAKLLAKGDAAAFMTGIQSGDLKMSGDYSLLMWFNQVSKFIVPKVPESLQPVVEHAKPLLEKAMPIAQGLFAKVQSLLGSDEPTKKSKYFDEENTKDLKDVSDSKLDAIKSKATELKEEVSEKLGELKTEAKDKLDTLKEDASEKLADIKETGSEKLDEAKAKLSDVKETAETKLADVKETAETKLADVKEQAETKLADVKETAQTKLTDVKETASDKLEATKAKVEEVQDKADSKLDALNEEAKEKISDAKQQAETDVKPSLEALKAQAASKLNQGQVNTTNPTKTDSKSDTDKASDTKQAASKATIDLDDVKAKFGTEETDDLTPAVAKSHQLEAKHADDEVIAKNVVTKAVEDDKSPITNISITRNESGDKDSGKPTITVQDKDGKSYTSK